ncbi:MAG: 4'-phosphopantetheinyl transferase superfamily protein [Thermoanaerobaculales bacterium]|nr:4'-phosphopantetheinyl transferase superfamily protein [Thermoanaerobaculales bacterium]
MSHVVRLLWFRVPASGDPRPEDLGLLDREERVRAERFTVDHPRRVFVAARAALRLFLGQELGADPATLKFSFGPHGKPRLDPPEDLHFNLSHSGVTVVMALAHGVEIGIDVEELRPTVSTLRLARRFFAPSEAAAVEAEGDSERVRTFFHCWTAKEAVLKATGSGLTVPIHEVEVDPDPDRPPRVIAIGGKSEEAARWTLLRHEIPGDWIATVAIRDGESQLVVEERKQAIRPANPACSCSPGRSERPADTPGASVGER